MQIERPDPRFTSGPRAQRNFRLALRLSIAVAAVLWVILFIDAFLGLDLGRFGLRPRQVDGLIGVVTAPLLHADAEHLFANTLPLLIGLTAMLYLYPNSAFRALPVMWLGSGLLAWFIARAGVHIGASGMIYGILAYVFVGGIVRREARGIAVAGMVAFFYGSMVWGVLPIRQHMSWEMHLAGAFWGIGLAIWFRSWDRPPVVRYDWEEDDTVPDWFPDDDDDVDEADRNVIEGRSERPRDRLEDRSGREP